MGFEVLGIGFREDLCPKTWTLNLIPVPTLSQYPNKREEEGTSNLLAVTYCGLNNLGSSSRVGGQGRAGAGSGSPSMVYGERFRVQGSGDSKLV